MRARLANDAAGTSATEFAAVLPFIAILFAGSIEFSQGFRQQVDLEQAAQRAVELAVIRPPMDNTVAEKAHIKTEAETALTGYSPTPTVTVTLYRDCNDTTQGTYVHTTNCASGRQADYVSVLISGTYTRWIDWKRFRGNNSTQVADLQGQATARVR